MDESVTNALKKVGEHFADFVKTLFIEGSKPITEIIPWNADFDEFSKYENQRELPSLTYVVICGVVKT